MIVLSIYLFFFFFNDTATTEIYTLSLHDALPISVGRLPLRVLFPGAEDRRRVDQHGLRSEEHTSELQSRSDLVCRLLLEKKKIYSQIPTAPTYYQNQPSSPYVATSGPRS